MFSSRASAAPVFAQQQDSACSACHTVWPLLNDFGRMFLANGYAVSEHVDAPEGMAGVKGIPPALRFNMRLLDKRTSRDRTYDPLKEGDKQLKMRAAHEVEVFFSNRVGNLFYFIELEAEDEWPDPAGDAPGFQVQIPAAFAGWVFSEAAVVRAGLSSPYGADGRNTVFSHKPHRYEWSASSRGFVPGDSQNLTFYGTVSGLFYNVAWHGEDDDLEGHDPEFYAGRLAYDLPVGLSIGGFYDTGKKYNGDTGLSEDKLDRYGADAQLQHDSGIQLNAVYAVKKEESTSNGTTTEATDKNLSLYLQYVHSGGDAPVAAVGVNYDNYTQNDDEDKWTKAAVFITWFARQNIKLQAGWEGTLDAPDRYEHKEARFTLVVDIGL